MALDSRKFWLDTGAVFLLSGLVNVLNYIFLVLSGHFLSKEDFGLFSTLVAILGLVTVFSNTVHIRVTQVLVTIGIRNARPYLTKLTALITLFFVVLTGLALPWASNILGNLHASVTDVLLTLLAALSLFYCAIANGVTSNLGALRIQAGSNALGSIVKVGLAIVLSFAPVSAAPWLFSYLLQFWVVIGCSAAAVLWLMKKPEVIGTPTFEKIERPSYITLLGYLLLVAPFLLDQVYVQVWNTLLSGDYGALAVLGKLSFFASSPILLVLQTYMINSKGKNCATLWRGVSLALGIAITTTVVVSLCRDFLVGKAFPARYAGVAEMLPLLSLSSTLFVVSYILVLQSIASRKRGFVLPLCVPVAMQGYWLTHENLSLHSIAQFQLYTLAAQLTALIVYHLTMNVIYRN